MVFYNLEELARFLGFYFPEEIHAVASWERWYTPDEQGDYHLDPVEMNDYLERCMEDIRVDFIDGMGRIHCRRI